MNILLVVDNPRSWPLHINNVEVVSARAYLTDPAYSEGRAKVFNLCKSYRYQTAGYYVSLLAAARGHKPMPDINTIQDLKMPSVIRALSEDLEDQIQKALRPLHSRTFTLSVYFGKNTARRYGSLALNLFNLFQVPLLRAEFIHEDEQWELKTIRPISANEIPENHREFVIEAASEYFAGRKRRPRKRAAPRFDLAVLVNPDEPDPPSNERALKKFQKAAESVGLDFELITRDDFHRLAEFDALFIRETTAVNHHTFRFAQRAAAEGLVVIDDPESILKCTNKVYLAELLTRHNVPTPKTLVVHKGNRDGIVDALSLPCVLKQPDSAFSRGVVKVDTVEELEREVARLLSRSDLIIAQQFLPTAFDWRVGVCDRRALYVCRYHMARKHWQIIHHCADGSKSEGECDTLSVGEAPDAVVNTALKAANLIGDGLYGVDLKQIDNKCYVMEVNDNPNIDAGIEDAVLKDALYRELMGIIIRRIEMRKR